MKTSELLTKERNFILRTPPNEVKRSVEILDNSPSDFNQNLASGYGIKIALDLLRKINISEVLK